MDKQRGKQYLDRYMSDAALRTRISLYPALAINSLFAVVKLGTGCFYGSVWLISLGVYYMLLALMRVAILRRIGRGNTSVDIMLEWRRYRACGFALLIYNWALTGITVLMVLDNDTFEFPGVLIYAMAAYTLYAVSFAVVNLFKFRKYGRPILSAAMVIRFSAALVSVLALETALLSRFGTNDGPQFHFVMTAATGGAICAIVLGLAVYMIVHGTRQLREGAALYPSMKAGDEL